ncbi:hypothetical protein [Niastella vici]|nr:hypothetical protein [Niastella vici]
MASYDGKIGNIIFKVFFNATVTEPYRKALQMLKRYYFAPGLEIRDWENFDNKIVVSQTKGNIKVVIKDEDTLAIDIYKLFCNSEEVKKVSLKYSKDSLNTLIDILRFHGVLKQNYKITKSPNDFIDF